MTFWNSRHVKKARKEHRCTYCRRVIKAGSGYHTETGLWEGDFQAHKFCERCHDYIAEYGEPGEFGTFSDEFVNSEILTCPKCGSNNLWDSEFADDVMSCDCVCGNCDYKWVQDLSFEAIKKLMKKYEVSSDD